MTNKAFISYSRVDLKWAKWLQAKLENYPVNRIFQDNQEASARKLRPVFLDKSDIRLGPLEYNLLDELRQSEFLIVICSPNAERSVWVNNEISMFLENHTEENIIPLIIDGTANINTDDQQKGYPPNLNRNISGLSVSELSKEKVVAKIVARMLRVDYEKLWQQHQRRKKRILYSTSLLLILMTLLGFLSYEPIRRMRFISKIESSEIAGIKELYLKASQNLDSIKSITLDANNTGYVNEISHFLKNVDTLEISKSKQEDLKILSSFKNIKSLHIKSNGALKSLDGLENLNKLKYLSILQNDSLISISSIQYMQQLKTLWIYDNGSSLNFSGIEKINSLDSLSITYNSSLKDLSLIKVIPNLRALYLGFSDHVYPADDLIGMKNLKSLYLPSTRPIDSVRIRKMRPDIHLEFVNGD